MITARSLAAILDGIDEKIELCGKLVGAGHCSWDCCVYSDSYILLLPGEWESAIALGFTLDHYTVIDPDYHGGVKLVPRSMGCCVAPEEGPSAYKSLDCRLFPFWFQVDDDELVMIQGLSCPIVQRGISIARHLEQARRVGDLLGADADVLQFLRVARMVNYEAVRGAAS